MEKIEVDKEFLEKVVKQATDAYNLARKVKIDFDNYKIDQIGREQIKPIKTINSDNIQMTLNVTFATPYPQNPKEKVQEFKSELISFLKQRSIAEINIIYKDNDLPNV